MPDIGASLKAAFGKDIRQNNELERPDRLEAL
jgi:hypothetical protein